MEACRGLQGLQFYECSQFLLIFFSPPKPVRVCHAVVNKTCWHDRPLAASLHYRDTVSSDELLRLRGGGEIRGNVETAS